MWFLGIVIGFILGARRASGLWRRPCGALVGFIIALAIRSRSQTGKRQAASRQLACAAAPGGAPRKTRHRRRAHRRALAGIEDRLRVSRRALGALRRCAEPQRRRRPCTATARRSQRRSRRPSRCPQAPAAVHARRRSTFRPTRARGSCRRRVRPRRRAATRRQRCRARCAARRSLPGRRVGARSAAGEARERRAAADAAAPNPLWAWFTGGNALTRIGVVVLFFGVAFLLRYFAEHFTIPIELRLAGVALAGVALIALGMQARRHARPGYGLSLQGAGAGILYLTTYRGVPPLRRAAADRPRSRCSSPIAALTVWLALRNDSQPLAGLAIAGGFLAPILVDDARRRARAAVRLLRGAERRDLRAGVASARGARSTCSGFVFTFVLGFVLGPRVLRARAFRDGRAVPRRCSSCSTSRSRFSTRGAAPLDGDARPSTRCWCSACRWSASRCRPALVRDMRYGAAWSALALAAVYGVLFARRCAGARSPGSRCWRARFSRWPIVFATIAIPFAVGCALDRGVVGGRGGRRLLDRLRAAAATGARRSRCWCKSARRRAFVLGGPCR